MSALRSASMLVMVALAVAACGRAAPSPEPPSFETVSTSGAADMPPGGQFAEGRPGEAGGTILVPADKVDSERLSAAAAGLPSAGTTGYALLDSMGVTARRPPRKVTLRASTPISL